MATWTAAGPTDTQLDCLSDLDMAFCCWMDLNEAPPASARTTSQDPLEISEEATPEDVCAMPSPGLTPHAVPALLAAISLACRTLPPHFFRRTYFLLARISRGTHRVHLAHGARLGLRAHLDELRLRELAATRGRGLASLFKHAPPAGLGDGPGPPHLGSAPGRRWVSRVPRSVEHRHRVDGWRDEPGTPTRWACRCCDSMAPRSSLQAWLSRRWEGQLLNFNKGI